jgi:signal peptidase I
LVETGLKTDTQTDATADHLPRPRLKRSGFLREILDLIVLVGAIYALVNLATVRFVVDGPSMEPSFYNGQFLIVSRVSYLVSDPQRGDVVVFHYPRNTEEDYIKRVIGLPGDTVEIRDTEVYVNGQQLEEPYINEPCRPERCRDSVWELGPDEFFVMGDNRNRSQDSRDFSAVPREFVVGQVFVRYWPPTDWGLVGSFSYSGN